MNKIINKINFAIVAMLVSVDAFAASVCDVFYEYKLYLYIRILRWLAFGGVFLCLGLFIWTYFSKKKIKKLKRKRIVLLVLCGLFLVLGLLMVFLSSAAAMLTVWGCCPWGGPEDIWCK